MAQQRTLPEKVEDVKTTFAQFRELLTPEVMRSVLDNMTGAEQQAAAASGDVQAYAALVQAALNLQRLVFANDRAALMAAVLATQSGVVRPQLDVIDGGE